MSNIHDQTVVDFGDEWTRHDQSALSVGELTDMFEAYFLPEFLNGIDTTSEGFDFGCGSGRWAQLLSERVRTLHCIDASEQALSVARKKLANRPNCRFHHGSIEQIGIEDGTQDFGYSLGVLHHMPDTEKALRDCAAKLKPGGLFLVYLYYRFDNRPTWFRLIWKITDIVRGLLVRLPHKLRNVITDMIAVSVYYPLSRTARLFSGSSAIGRNWPLRSYANSSLATLRTDARDRFGTHLEKRFTRDEIAEMCRTAGLEVVRVSDQEPFWTMVGRKTG